MKVLVTYIQWLCVVLVFCYLASLTVVEIKNSADNYMDNRIRQAINTERQFVYKDLAKLHPRRVLYTRYGIPYILSENI